MEKQRILLIEDEVNLLNSLCYILENDGYQVFTSTTGRGGVALALEHRPHLCLVDIGLPDIDGFEVACCLTELRQTGMQLVFLSGRNEEEDIVHALEDLAEDYLVKPVRPRVLLARIHHFLSQKRPSAPPETLKVGPLVVNPLSCVASLEGVPLPLTPTEFKIIKLLAAEPGRAFSRTCLIHRIHGESCHVTEKSIDYQIHCLRKKLGPHAGLLATVRGFGFALHT